LTPSPSEVPPAPEELDALLRLLDDDTPEVRERVAERLALWGGDISEWLAAHPRHLSAAEKSVLARLLGSPRRMALEREWLVPTGGAAALREDWEAFEAMLRALSDFLHDGITIRQPLSDALDLLAEEAEEAGVDTAIGLRSFLFEGGRLAGNQDDYEDPRNSDLAWSIAEGKSNPLGLCLIFALVARRMNLIVEPVNFPGHFLCRIFEDGYPIIIDCFDRGRLHLQATLLENPDIGREERAILRQTADPGTVLLRLLNNLLASLQDAGRSEDAQLIRKLRATLK
jgi:regulator of sirC expression with transglutaminase-like and TPR domain